MARHLVSCSLVLAAVACSDSFGPSIYGRWASPGAELWITPTIRRYTVACNRPVSLPLNVRFDETGTIRFTGNLTNSSGSYPFAFVGQLIGDTLVATMSVTYGSSGSWTGSVAMARDGDAAFGRLACPV